jgi:hypothetical protein
MKNILSFVTGAILGCTLLGCVPAEQTALPDNPNDPTQMNEFQNAIKELPANDQKDIIDFITRMGEQKKAGGYGYIRGMRAQEALAKQREWIKEETARNKAEFALQEKMALEAAAKKTADKKVESELRGICNISLKKKKKAGNKLSMTLKFENKGDKEIVGMYGKLQFLDKKDEVLKEIKIPLREKLKAKKSVTWSGDLPFNKAKEKDVAFAKIPIADLKVNWLPDNYTFADGTRIGKGI